MGRDLQDPGWRDREQECLARARAGDRAAIGELYAAHAPALYRRILLPRLGDAAAAEDALADTFTTALARLDQFEDRGQGLWPWLARIAANTATDLHRARARTGRALAGYADLLAPFLPRPEDPETALDRQRGADALRVRLGAVLERINPRYRRAIELRFLEERPRADCAAALEVKVGTFDVLLLRSLRACRREWAAMAGEGGDE